MYRESLKALPRLCEVRWESCVLFTICRQENATFPHHILTTWEEPFRGFLYESKSNMPRRHYAWCSQNLKETIFAFVTSLLFLMPLSVSASVLVLSSALPHSELQRQGLAFQCQIIIARSSWTEISPKVAPLAPLVAMCRLWNCAGHTFCLFLLWGWMNPLFP